MAAHTVDHDCENITGRRDGTRAHKNLPFCLTRQVVKRKNPIAWEPLEKTVLDHLHRAALIFFGGLKNQTNGAIEIACLGEESREPKQHGRMAVMPAGMHLAGIS